MSETAKIFLDSIIRTLCRGSYEILTEVTEVGVTFVVIPQLESDYAILIGYKGRNSKILRNLMKMWSKVNAKGLRTNVFIPNPKLIKKE